MIGSHVLVTKTGGNVSKNSKRTALPATITHTKITRTPWTINQSQLIQWQNCQIFQSGLFTYAVYTLFTHLTAVNVQRQNVSVLQRYCDSTGYYFSPSLMRLCVNNLCVRQIVFVFQMGLFKPNVKNSLACLIGVVSSMSDRPHDYLSVTRHTGAQRVTFSRLSCINKPTLSLIWKLTFTQVKFCI